MAGYTDCGLITAFNDRLGEAGKGEGMNGEKRTGLPAAPPGGRREVFFCRPLSGEADKEAQGCVLPGAKELSEVPAKQTGLGSVC